MFATLTVRVTLIREKVSCNKVVQFNPIVSYLASMGLIFIRLNKKAKVKRILVAAKKITSLWKWDIMEYLEKNTHGKKIMGI